MEDTGYRAIAVVGLGAVLPDAPNVPAFWDNVKSGRYSITDVTRDRWDPALYFDSNPAAPDKSYSKIGGWVRDYAWDPMKWHLALPPRVVDAMDVAQKWAIACTRQALEDYGYPNRPLDANRTAVILGNAMAGEKHYLTSLRVYFPEYARELQESASFAALPEKVRRDITREMHDRMAEHLPPITEDSMPGELANCIAGRIANIYNFHGPNYVVDAACASAMAAISSAVEGLIEHDFDAVVTGGIDRNMGASTYVKFCKIGALSATGTRPYAEGADGFVMGEGAAIFVLKRLADAEQNGDKIYAVLRGLGGSSDGKGKGITAPNPVGQKLAVERAWQNAGVSPGTATLIEGHGTSTRVGDVVEVQSMAEVLNQFHLPPRSVALGSVKSNIGHLKGAAGAAGFLKTTLALHEKVLPPSVHCEHPNPDIDFAHTPLYVNTELKPWAIPNGEPRRAGLSAFGFGGTNFHAVLEEYIPHRLTGNGKRSVAVGEIPRPVNDDNLIAKVTSDAPSAGLAHKAPLRGALVIGAASQAALVERLRCINKDAQAGRVPQRSAPAESDLRAAERIAIDYGDAAELASKSSAALKAFAVNQAPMWKAFRAQGIYRGHGPTPKVAFLYTGQGSQYVNMLKPLRELEPIVADTFAEADRVMTPLLGKPLSYFIFVDGSNGRAIEKAEDDLRQTAITQPAVLATDLALTRLLAAYGVQPDFTMGHSLGEYGALVAAGALPFSDALEAVSARGREMTRVSMKDNGRMAAVFGPLEEIERLLKTVQGYVVIANLNSEHQAVIGGASDAVERAIGVFQKAGYEVTPLPVSHAFHTSIVAPASEPLREMLKRLHLESPRVPIVANVNGEFYPTGPNAVAQMLDILAQQVAAPVQFVKGLTTLYQAGARVFVEVGPKKALQGFAEDVLGARDDVISLFTNHPKLGDVISFNQALCGLYATGLGRGTTEMQAGMPEGVVSGSAQETVKMPIDQETVEESTPAPARTLTAESYTTLGRMFADTLERAWKVYQPRNGGPDDEPVVITGAALGLPGTEHVFDDSNIARILRGDQFIDSIPTRFRRAMVDKHITRLVKSDNGGPTFESINSVADVIKLAGRGGAFDLEEEFGVPAERIAALDRVTELAIAAGIDALRDAGIPLVMKYKTTSKGTQLPDRWMLPGTLRDDTGVIFASAFPGYNSFAKIMADYYADHAKREQLAMLGDLRLRVAENNGHSILTQELDRRIAEMRAAIESQPFVFDRRFLFRVLSMGHSQFAEYIGARGPNTQVNAACASTTQAVGIAEDWIHAGRCRRVIVVSADDITSDNLIDWMGAGFLASGAAATDDVVEEAAIPFDRRRHGMIIGMGGAALVVESSEAAKERGLQPICEVLSAVTANSAFHGTRLDVQHISQVMEDLIGRAEKRCGIDRRQIANRTVFVSHETYTPARGGSASAEIHALRHVFGDAADQIVIANTKGFTGHAMATGIEDVVAVKALETACVPPVPNFQEVDPELGRLNLAKGGMYPVEYALRLGAGFGSQISMTLMRWTATKDGSHRNPSNLGYSYRIADQNAWSEWLAKVAGQKAATLEVVRHTLRVKDENARIATAKPNGDEILSTRVPRMASQDVETARVTRSAPAHVATQSSVAPERVAPAAVSASIPSTDEVKDRVLGLVAAKTGYPVDMLDLDLDLEADLGIDTVKQAEVFAAIREDYGITRDNQLKLRDFPTLAHVIGFVYDRRPELEKPAPSPRVETKPEIQTTASHSVVQGPKEDAVQERILTLVMEKTGYPKDMLDLDLDLEADLGIDTVKQAEMFAAIREIYNIPRDENRKLRDYPTLSHVIRFVYEKRSDLAGTSQTSTIVSQGAVEQPTVAAGNENSIDDVTGKVLAIVSEKTGYPKEMLDLDLDLEADLGIDTVKQAEMFAAVRAAYDIPRDENLKLRDFPTLAHVIKFAVERRAAVAASPRSAATPAQTAERPASPRAQGSVPDALVRPIPMSFDAANRIPRRVPVAKLRPALSVFKTTGVTLTPGRRIAIMPDLAGVGEALAAQAQKSGAEVLRIDRKFNANELDAQLKTWLASGGIDGVYWLPALDDEGPLSNMGLSSWREAVRIRTKLLYVSMRALYEQIAKPGTFLITATRLGGQHGYDEAGAMAPLGGAVTGFTKAYKRERPDALVKAIDFTSDATISQISEVLIEETLLDPGIVEIGYKYGERWTCALEEQPATDGQPGLQLDSRSVFLITGAAGSIVSAITADLAAASGGTFYLLDVVPEPDPNNADLKQFVSDKEALKRELFNRIQARGERATPALVEKELAGLERALAARTAIDAARAAGGTARYFSVDLTNGDAVAKIINDVRQRSGRIDVLLHAAGVERSHLLKDKDTREFDLVFDVKADGFFNLLHAIADMPLGSTVAFSSIAGRFGNAGQTDYSSANDLLCKITSSLRRTRPDTRAIAIDWTAWGGIGMATRGSIPKMMEAAGIDMLTAEAGIPTIRRELTSGGTRGEVVIAQGLGVLLNEWEAGGGIEVLAKEAAARGAMIGNSMTVGADHSISIETELSPVEQPFLHDHQIDGTPVLPGVMGVEAFAEAAALLFPALTVASVENVNFVAPFKFYRNEPRTVSVRVRPRWEENAVLADCELLGSRILPNQKEPQVTTHFTGTVRLTKELSTGATARPIGTPTGQMIDAKLIYGVYFHGPAYQVLERGWWNGIRMIGLLNDRLPANHHPPNLKLMLAPRLIELCFQTAGLWELGVQGRMGLPLHIHQVRLERNPEQTEGRLYATVTPDPDNGGFDVEVIDAAGIRYMHVTGYRTVALPQGADSEALKSLQTAMSLQAVAA